MIISAQASGWGTVVFHVPDKEPEPGQEDPAPPAASRRAVWVHYDREGLGSGVQAGRVLELVSCSGPYGDWSGVLRAGGLAMLPFVDLPVEFAFRAASGVQVTQTDTAGKIAWMLREDGAPSGVTSHVEYLLVVAVDGQTMRVRTYGTADEQVEGQQLLDEITESAEVTMPIEPAPPGACP